MANPYGEGIMAAAFCIIFLVIGVVCLFFNIYAGFILIALSIVMWKISGGMFPWDFK